MKLQSLQQSCSHMNAVQPLSNWLTVLIVAASHSHVSVICDLPFGFSQAKTMGKLTGKVTTLCQKFILLLFLPRSHTTEYKIPGFLCTAQHFLSTLSVCASALPSLPMVLAGTLHTIALACKPCWPVCSRRHLPTTTHSSMLLSWDPSFFPQ